MSFSVCDEPTSLLGLYYMMMKNMYVLQTKGRVPSDFDEFVRTSLLLLSHRAIAYC